MADVFRVELKMAAHLFLFTYSLYVTIGLRKILHAAMIALS